MSRRENRNIKTASLMKSIGFGKLIAGMCVAAGSAGFIGCSESNTTAGVLSETESGQTASLTVSVFAPVDADYAMARAYLLKVEDGHTTIIDTASVDSNFNVTFSKVPYNSDFSIVANALNNDGNVNLSGIITRKVVETECGLTDEGFSKDSINLAINTPATLQVSTGIAEFSLGDSICITGTTACGVFDDSAKKSGFILIKDIPATTAGEKYIDYSQIEIISEGEVSTDSISWRVFPGDSAIAAKDAVVETIAKMSFTIPSVSSLDSLEDMSLDSLLVSFKRATENSDNIVSAMNSKTTQVFMDNQWNVLPHDFTKGTDSATYWISLPSLKDSVQVQYVHGEVAPDAYKNDSRLRAFEPIMENGDKFSQPLFKDSSFALSFWIQNGEVQAKDSASNIDADSSVILSAIEDEVGFEIRKCGAKGTEACLKIYNGVDTAATDTVEYAKTNLLDGKKHHYSMVIHKKHLSIVVDGKVLRNTDLKLSENIYKLESLKINTAIENVLLYSFGDFIRKPEDRGWHRMNAWLQAFYELQK